MNSTTADHADNSARTVGAVLAVRGVLAVLAVCLLGSASALAQFEQIAPQTDIVEQLEGQLLSAEGAPAPEPGDQVAAFFGDQIIGVFTFVSGQADPRAWNMIIFGDDPNTQTKEGPASGEIITFRFFDISTNMTRLDVAPVNAQGEIINVPFEGEFTFQFPIDIPGAPPFPGAPGPTNPFDLILGVAAPAPPTDGGGGNNPTPQGNPDVNGDGVADKRDAALVLRVITGATRRVTSAEAARADVNNDGVVNTRDVIAILSPRNSTRHQPANPGASDEESQ